MKTFAGIVLSLVIGFAAGWVLFRSKKMADFRNMIHEAGISEQQVIEAHKSIPTIVESLESDNGVAAVISLAALRMLEENKVEDTKRFLAQQPASYFVIYGPSDNPNKKITKERLSTLRAIEKAQENSPFLKDAIQQSISNIKQE
jgi:hypothetical protein